MLLTLAPEVHDTLPTQEGEVRLHTSCHSTMTELTKRLSVLLAISDCCPQCRRIEVFGDGWQAFESQRRQDDGSLATVEAELQCSVVNQVVLNAVGNQFANDLGKWKFAGERGAR